MRIPPLYHFTCRDHGLPGIRKRMTLKPQPSPFTCTPVVWLTSDPDATWEQLGLTSTILDCDRMDVRCTVETTRHCLSWAAYALKRGLPVGAREVLETGRETDSWWVSERPLRVAALAELSDA